MSAQYSALKALEFNLRPTQANNNQESAQSSLSGKSVVFTGTMQSGSRSDLQQQAKELGAKIATSVTGNTDYLITGDKVGARKIEAAEAKGVTVLTEEEYLSMLQKIDNA